jgi:hypothetical protein
MRLLATFALVSTLAGASASAPSAANCSGTSVPMTPLTDLGAATYHGYHGGLYPGLKNTPSGPYLSRGLAAARNVKPIGGKIVLLSIGMSNTTLEFQQFQREAHPAADVVVVDGAFPGQDAEKIKDPSYAYWGRVDGRLAAAGATAAQVQAVWLKEAIAQENEPFPADAQRLRGDLGAIVQILQQRYPNLQLIYVSSRTYGGYATTTLNPEPYAYDSGFAVKWLVGDVADGHLKARPWVGWGPYLWTNGTKGRADGLTWTCDDVRPQDGTHPSADGQRKVADLLVRFFETGPTTKSWFTSG